MRCFLSKELRRRFDIAWGMLPEGRRDEFRESIRRVTEVQTLLGAGVKCHDGSMLRSEEEAFAWTAYDWSISPAQCHLLLTERQLTVANSEAFAIATILHELGHVGQLVDFGRGAAGLSDERAEIGAWLQAAAWAANSQSPYQGALDVICEAMGPAARLLEQMNVKELAQIFAEPWNGLTSPGPRPTE